MICQGLTREQSNEIYRDVLAENNPETLRRFCKEDLFFLLTVACKRRDIDRDWLYDRCREVEKDPDGYLDLWPREHYKSTIITFGRSIQDVLKDSNVTIGLFSHTRPIAKAFLNQIKTELEQNKFLKSLFPDVLYQDPQKQSPRWSLDLGLRVKRSANPKEETFEAWGLVDGQPTSKHFSVLVYDDVVTRESVSTVDQIKKTTDAWALSINLGAEGGKQRYIGTRYHMSDTYKEMIDRGSVIKREKTATDNGKWPGNSVFLNQESLERKRRDMGPYIFSAQMLQNPTADKAMSFSEKWLKFYETLGDIKSWNKYILVDPANEKKASSDYTVIAVIGLAPDNNYYLIDAVRDRLNLTQRTAKLFEFHRQYRPNDVGYEKYGKDSDIQHIQEKMERDNYRFNIKELGGSMKKNDRIKRLVPVFEQLRFWMPKKLSFVDYEGRSVDFVQLFIDNEYKAFPVCTHDDMFDCFARILDSDLGAEFPKSDDRSEIARQLAGSAVSSGGWMG